MVPVWSSSALADLRRLHEFLRPKSRRAADGAILAIRTGVTQLADFPFAGRAHPSIPDRRELIVRNANSGYSVLYAVDADALRIIAVRHMREDHY